MTGEKNTRHPTFISSGTFLDRESISPTSINTRSPRDNWITKSSSTTWEKSINGTIVRTESESDKREAKKSRTSQSSSGRGRNLTRTSNLYATSALRLFIAPSLFVSARFPRRARESRVARASRDGYARTGKLAIPTPIPIIPFSAVGAPPNKVERPVGGRLQLEARGLEARAAAERGGGDVTIAFPRNDTIIVTRVSHSRDTRLRVTRKEKWTKLTELCGELDTLGERCTVTSAMAMRRGTKTPRVASRRVASRRVASSRGTSRRTRQTLARHCSHARTSTIAPSRARTSRHFSRTFDGITLAAMFDTIDGRTAHARAAADFFSLPPPRAPNRLPFYRVFTMIPRQFLFSYVVREDCAVFFFLFFNESIFPPLADK